MGNDQKISVAAKESYTCKAGLLPEPVSLESYRSEAFYELERDRVFGRSWLTLAREEELPKPGDYLVRDIEVLGASVIVARGRDGRSEEHTSELQSLMRISYAVFCLKN